jgi:hypothetical protein
MCFVVAEGLVKGRLAEEICPLEIVNEVALPMVAPALLRNAIVPVHDAAAPLEDVVARFRTLIWAVSVLPRPMRENSRVVVLVVVCAIAPTAIKPEIATDAIISRRRNIVHLVTGL